MTPELWQPRPAWRLRIAGGWYRAKESLFLVPAVILAAAIALVALAGAADRALQIRPPSLFTVDINSNAAIWLLSTVAGAMVTTAGVVFSLTVVTLQLASSQFSPRVMRFFIRDRFSQAVIGLLVATFVYCLLGLGHVSADADAPAPTVTLTVAVILTLVTVIGIIAHLDRLSRRLQVGHVVEGIADEGRLVLGSMSDVPTGLHSRPEAPSQPPADAAMIPCSASGWISQVDARGLLSLTPPGTTVRLETRVGAYIHGGEPLLTVWPAPSLRVQSRLAQAVSISESRTMLQDVDFAIRQLVDIGLRALSSAINDPTTAVEVLLRLGTLLRQVLTSPLGPQVVGDARNRVLIRPWDLNHAEYVDHAFDELRQAGAGQLRVVAALMRVLRMLIAHMEAEGHPEHIPTLQRQIRLLRESLSHRAEMHADDLRWLDALAADETDPADHSRAGREWD